MELSKEKNIGCNIAHYSLVKLVDQGRIEIKEILRRHKEVDGDWNGSLSQAAQKFLRRASMLTPSQRWAMQLYKDIKVVRRWLSLYDAMKVLENEYWEPVHGWEER